MSKKFDTSDTQLAKTKVHTGLCTPANVTLPSATERLLHELQVYQIELEMQNEALRESQLALEKSRDRYLDLYEFAPIGYLTLTHDALIADINLTGATLLGEERNKLIRRRFTNHICPGDRDRWHQLFVRTMQQAQKQSCEMEFMRADGSRFNAQIDCLHLVIEGDSAMVRLTLTDITKHIQAQANERQLRHILDNTQDMIFIFAPDTLRFEYMNKGAIAGIGYSQQELLQMSPPDVLMLIPEPECRAFIAPLISGKKKMRRFETTVRRKDGRDFPVEVQLQLIKENGGDGLFVAIVRDITRRRFADRALRQQKNLMWQVIDADPNMIFVKDAAGKFLLANQTLADYYGVTIQDLIGKSHTDLDPDPQGNGKFLASELSIIEDRFEEISTESLSKDSKQYWYRTFKRPLPQADGSFNTLGIAVDISDLKMSGIKLAESYKELQRLALHLENVRAEERTQIARNLHDEMGATLAALKMRVAWLASKLPAGMPHLSSEVDHISDLVSAGIQTVRQVVTNLRPNLLDDVGLAAALKDFIKNYQRNTEIECTLVLPENEFSLDENQSVTVFRIIQESLSNTAKHSRADKVKIVLEVDGESLRLQIQDNGIGFDPIHKEQCFGLLGIKERALMIGGTATISSTPGQGTEVALTIHIPAVR